MKTKLLSLFAAALFALVSTSAQAVTVDPIDLSSANLDNVVFDSGNTYLDYVAPASRATAVTFDGTLSSKSILTLTYSIDGGTLRKASGTSAYLDIPGTSLWIDTDMNKLEDSSSSLSILLSGIIDNGNRTGILTISNLSSQVAFVSVLFDALMSTTAAGVLRVSASVAPVPLPAALPLFGLGIASLVGYGAKRKKAKEA